MKREVLRAPIRRATELRGLGATARRCGVSHTHLRKVLQGERKPSAELERKMRRMGLRPSAYAPEALRRDKGEMGVSRGAAETRRGV